MFSCRREALVTAVIALSALGVPSQAQVSSASSASRVAKSELGRAATVQEIQAWDIDVRPDFQGLPKGSGSALAGQPIWENRCAACHGVFGDSGEFASPIVGGTTAEDIAAGRAASLADPSYPRRTTLMQLTTVSTLWDYIRRAMPWNAPKSLSPDEVYAVTAYLLFLAGIVGEDFVLSDASIADVQARLPNRHGGTTNHAMWPGRAGAGRAVDTRNSACMKDCEADVVIASALPANARNAHGNLADQNRLVGAQRGAATGDRAETPADGDADRTLPLRFACTTCHDAQRPVFGPSFQEIAKRYGGNIAAVPYLAEKIRSGSMGNWGALAMPPQDIDPADAFRIARWLASGART